MFVRTTQLEIDTVRMSMDGALAMFEESVLPELRNQPGFCGIYVCTSPEGKALLLSFWDSAEAADAGAAEGWYPSTLDKYTTLFRSPPGRERYEVRVALPPAMARST